MTAKPENCPECGFRLLWAGAKPPASIGFCEECGAYWIHQPDRGVEDCTEAVYAMLGMGENALPSVMLKQVRAKDERGRMMRYFAAQRMRLGLTRRANGHPEAEAQAQA